MPTMRDKARTSMLNAYAKAAESFAKRKQKLSFSRFRGRFKSSIYTPHRGVQERARCAKSYPSRDLSRYGH